MMVAIATNDVQNLTELLVRVTTESVIRSAHAKLFFENQAFLLAHNYVDLNF